MIEARDVVVRFGAVQALAGVSLTVERHRVTGLVGESGSGKTTLCRVLMGLVWPEGGDVWIDGVRIADRLRQDAKGFHRGAQMLLQDAAGSLSPRMTVRRLLDEPAAIHGFDRAEARARSRGLMARLGLPDSLLDRYPHQLSGGQARRVAIVRALVAAPSLLVADEPTAGLDVSVQGELLNLLLDLRQEFDLTILVSSHNLNVVRRISTRVVVMYLGEVVEAGDTEAVFAAPAHPYTAALLSTNPAIDPARRRSRIVLAGDQPSPAAPPAGCRFHTRCFQVQDRCRREHPSLGSGRTGGVRCFFPLSGS